MLFAAVVAGLLFAAPPALPSIDLEAALIAAAPELDREVLTLALRAYATATQRGDATQPTLAIIDYRQPSTKKRLWLFDLKSRRVLLHELVAHGKGSGDNLATQFSNEARSLKSSLGLFLATDEYLGQHGRSLRLRGLEPGINDHALARSIVIHAADYVSADFAQQHGRLGRSWGCPAVSPSALPDLITALREGGLVFAYYPDRTWLDASIYLRL